MDEKKQNDNDMDEELKKARQQVLIKFGKLEQFYGGQFGFFSFRLLFMFDSDCFIFE